MIIKLKYNQGKRVIYSYSAFRDLLEKLIDKTYGKKEYIYFMNNDKDNMTDDTKFIKSMLENKKVGVGDMCYLHNIIEKLDTSTIVNEDKQFWSVLSHIIDYGARVKDPLLIIGGE